MKRKTKAPCQRIHAKRRLQSRYNLEINRHEVHGLISTLSDATFLVKKSNRVTIHLVEHKGQHVVAVYDKIRKTIITFLPLDAREIKDHPKVLKVTAPS